MDLKPINIAGLRNELEKFKQQHAAARVIDTYREQLQELFNIRSPQFRFQKQGYDEALKSFFDDHFRQKPESEAGNWFYFPWNQCLVHFLPDELHQELRTARNKNLITAEEQNKFYNFNVGITGLSVGSHAALTLAMMGGGKTIKLSDLDTLSGSNLNRIRGDFTEIGQEKCGLVAQKIYQLNPYAEIHAYPQGITLENLREFLAGPPKLDVLVESLDNPELKIRLRLEAKKLGIPVIMATDNGDNIIFDVERYDLDPNLKLFNGVAGDLTLEQFQQYPPQDLPKLATQIAGSGLVVPRMLDSVSQVGRTLYSWPQLGDAATLAGVATAYVVKRLALGQKLRTGKMEVNLDAVFDPDYNETKQQQDQERQKFLSQIGL